MLLRRDTCIYPAFKNRFVFQGGGAGFDFCALRDGPVPVLHLPDDPGKALPWQIVLSGCFCITSFLRSRRLLYIGPSAHKSCRTSILCVMFLSEGNTIFSDRAGSRLHHISSRWREGLKADISHLSDISGKHPDTASPRSETEGRSVRDEIPDTHTIAGYTPTA